MAAARDPRIKASLRSGSAAALLVSLLFLNAFSDRLHSHPATEEGLGPSRSAGALSGLVPASPPEEASHRSLPCLACLHHRSPGMSPSAALPAGRLIVLEREGSVPIPTPPPAPLPPPTGLRAPPLS